MEIIFKIELRYFTVILCNASHRTLIAVNHLPRYKFHMATAAKPQKHKNDQLAMDPPKKVQSILVQSPEPLNIIGNTFCSGNVSIMP